MAFSIYVDPSDIDFYTPAPDTGGRDRVRPAPTAGTGSRLVYSTSTWDAGEAALLADLAERVITCRTCGFDRLPGQPCGEPCL